MEESKINIKEAYLIDQKIWIAGHTHSDKSHKINIHVKHLRHHTYGENYHCNKKRRNKLSLWNTTQTCDKYDVRYTHEKYKANDNYICKYNSKPYSEYYHKRRTKIRSAVYSFKRTTRMKQVSYAMTSGDCTFTAVQWDVNTMNKQNGNVTRRTMSQRSKMNFLSMTNKCELKLRRV